MLSNHTALIVDGCSLKDFVQSCARAFDYNITLRDEPDGPIPEYVVDRYYSDSVESAKRDLYELEAMSDEEMERMLESRFQERKATVLEIQSRCDQERLRLQEMLKKITDWVPPTEKHENLKEYMIQQVTVSLGSYCYIRTCDIPERETVKEYRDRQRQYLLESIEDASRRYDEEVQIVAERNAWNRTLFESIKDM